MACEDNRFNYYLSQYSLQCYNDFKVVHQAKKIHFLEYEDSNRSKRSVPQDYTIKIFRDSEELPFETHVGHGSSKTKARKNAIYIFLRETALTMPEKLITKIREYMNNQYQVYEAHKNKAAVSISSITITRSNEGNTTSNFDQVVQNVNSHDNEVENLTQIDQVVQNSTINQPDLQCSNITDINVSGDSLEKMKNVSADSVDQILNTNKAKKSDNIEMVSDDDILKFSSGYCASKSKTKRAGKRFQKWKKNYRARLLKLKEDGLLDDYKKGEIARMEESIRNNSDELDHTIEKFTSFEIAGNIMNIFVEWREHKELKHVDYASTKVEIDNCLETANESLAEMLDSFDEKLKRSFVNWFKKHRPKYDLNLILMHCKKNKHIF